MRDKITLIRKKKDCYDYEYSCYKCDLYNICKQTENIELLVGVCVQGDYWIIEEEK